MCDISLRASIVIMFASFVLLTTRIVSNACLNYCDFLDVSLCIGNLYFTLYLQYN